MVMSAENKILTVMGVMKEKAKLAPITGKGRFIFDLEKVTIDGVPDDEILSITKDLLMADVIVSDGKDAYSFAMGERFDRYYNALKKHTTIERETRKSPLLWLTYSDKKLMLNNIFLIHTTNMGSSNGKVLFYLMHHSNQIVTRDEMKKNGCLAAGESKDFHSFLNDIKMKGWMKALFFPKDISHDTLYFRNPIYREDIESGEVKIVDLGNFLAKLEN